MKADKGFEHILRNHADTSADRDNPGRNHIDAGNGVKERSRTTGSTACHASLAARGGEKWL